jgi:uncharacterized protein (DUF302 family)
MLFTDLCKQANQALLALLLQGNYAAAARSPCRLLVLVHGQKPTTF